MCECHPAEELEGSVDQGQYPISFVGRCVALEVKFELVVNDDAKVFYLIFDWDSPFGMDAIWSRRLVGLQFVQLVQDMCWDNLDLINPWDIVGLFLAAVSVCVAV
ncbi:hypothetical protein QYM36_017154 [Artemia franciscana]|uniref:Uncharacterized protein n=1 Tax=Artemia franciscana TaxID=6661 RepID=A0AA88H7E5_ARTSF|nr:hypothetical protein QYM36_017154 [Artemia franciscana]